jgi:glycosyltransferase involved in cell wall biosynthesis
LAIESSINPHSAILNPQLRMSTIVVATSSPPAAEGGHIVLARALVKALCDAGYDGRLVVTPDYGFGRQTSAYVATWRTDISTIEGRRVDQVISLRYPSYAVRHPTHVCWLNHCMREYYDLWPQLTASISWRNLVKENLRKIAIHAADRWLLTHNVNLVIAESRTIQRRLAEDFGIPSEVVYPPPPQRSYRCDGYGDYIFTVSRLVRNKRIDLLIRALADASARHVKAIIAGDGDQRSRLEDLARALGVAERVAFLGRVDEQTILDHFARCRAVCFTPLSEDYGFVTVEAFASRKAVITCRDSGGPAEFVKDDVTGVVCETTPASIAIALARLSDDRALAERLGANAAAAVAALRWDDVVRRLLIV